jgi:predicted RNA-binding protein
MKYYLDIFSPETYEAFSESDKTITGFRLRHSKIAEHIQPGDKFLCYMTKLSRWIGVLEVSSESFQDDSPRFYEKDDPFIIRFKVKPRIWLDKDKSLPIHEDFIWNTLSLTKDYDKSSSKWTGKFRGSLSHIEKQDGEFLEKIMTRQVDGGQVYAVDQDEYQKYLTKRVRRQDRDVNVSIPIEETGENTSREEPTDIRKSAKVQAILAQIGEQMGFSIWLPKSDRHLVLREWQPEASTLLEQLPLNYDEVTLRTIEQIDVIWLKRRSIVRAFEIEHTTSVYSGILRMADLLALQPNMDIKLHIVAPSQRREKVFLELQRPVFSLLDKGPLSELCSYISYDSVDQLAEVPHIQHLSDSVLEDYEEFVE